MTNLTHSRFFISKRVTYRIRVSVRLDPVWSECLQGMTRRQALATLGWGAGALLLDPRLAWAAEADKNFELSKPPISTERYGVEHLVDAQVHIWAADTPERPWPKGGGTPPQKPCPVSAETMLLQILHFQQSGAGSTDERQTGQAVSSWRKSERSDEHHDDGLKEDQFIGMASAGSLYHAI